jgi:hypothetical protein
MAILGVLGKIFSSGVMGSVERIASEWIETDMETAEAKALFIKTLDPNGQMRRELSRFACVAYGYYLVITSILVLVTAFGPAPVPLEAGVPITTQAEIAAGLMTELFLPITTAWATIVGASFGVNGMNSAKGR